MSYLILLRHGQSRWNEAHRFTGQVDIPLSKKGLREAQEAAKHIPTPLDKAYVSTLTRAQETLLVALTEMNYTGVFQHGFGRGKIKAKHQIISDDEIPIISSRHLNERHYGKLQGKNKQEVGKEVGKEALHLLRRSFVVRPPGGENLKDVYRRTVRYAKRTIFKDVAAGNNVLVSAHGNSLRAIVKCLEGVSDHDVQYLEVPTGKPIIYEFSQGHFVRKGNIKLLHKPKPQSIKPIPLEETVTTSTVRLTKHPRDISLNHRTIHPLELTIYPEKIVIQGHPQWHDLSCIGHQRKVTIRKENILELHYNEWFSHAIQLQFRQEGKIETIYLKYMDKTLHPYSRKKTRELFERMQHLTPIPQKRFLPKQKTVRAKMSDPVPYKHTVHHHWSVLLAPLAFIILGGLTLGFFGVILGLLVSLVYLTVLFL